MDNGYKFLLLEGTPYEGYDPIFAYNDVDKAIKEAKDRAIEEKWGSWWVVVDLSLLTGSVLYDEAIIFSTDK